MMMELIIEVLTIILDQLVSMYGFFLDYIIYISLAALFQKSLKLEKQREKKQVSNDNTMVAD